MDPASIVGLNLFSYCYNDPVNFVDPSGCFAISTLIIGAIFGAVIVGGATYEFAKEKGAKGWELAGWTTLGILGGGILGALLGAFASMSFTSSIPTLGFVNTNGALAIGITGTKIVTITGAQVLTTTGVIAGLNYMFVKGEGSRMGHNQYENKQFRSLVKKYRLTKDQQRILHDEITKMNYDYHEIEKLIWELFFRRK